MCESVNPKAARNRTRSSKIDDESEPGDAMEVEQPPKKKVIGRKKNTTTTASTKQEGSLVDLSLDGDNSDEGQAISEESKQIKSKIQSNSKPAHTKATQPKPKQEERVNDEESDDFESPKPKRKKISRKKKQEMDSDIEIIGETTASSTYTLAQQVQSQGESQVLFGCDSDDNNMQMQNILGHHRDSAESSQSIATHTLQAEYANAPQATVVQDISDVPCIH